MDFDEFFAWFQYEFSHDKQHGKMENFRVSKVIPLKQRATRLLLPKFVEGELEDDFGTKVAAPGQGVVTVDGIDDRWWLDEVEKQKESYSHYLKRKEGIRILEEKRNQKVIDDAEEAARQKELNMTHEEKVTRRKEKDADKAKKLAQMKKRLSMKRHMNIAQQEIEKAHELEELEEEGGGGGRKGRMLRMRNCKLFVRIKVKAFWFIYIYTGTTWDFLEGESACCWSCFQERGIIFSWRLRNQSGRVFSSDQSEFHFSTTKLLTWGRMDL